MPIYEYRCKCGNAWDDLVEMKNRVQKCPKCDAENSPQISLSRVSFANWPMLTKSEASDDTIDFPVGG